MKKASQGRRKLIWQKEMMLLKGTRIIENQDQDGKKIDRAGYQE
ncbi:MULTISPECIES: hypothetical protein [Robinsoniella]|nr:hypothetical protein [Robinsoniella peoriensis]